MSKFLIRYYPIYPAQSIEVFQLDVLDREDYSSKNYQEFVRDILEDYNCALECHPQSIVNGVLFYNNCSWSIEECQDIGTAIEMHVNRLRK